jgi:hypothetical protein
MFLRQIDYLLDLGRAGRIATTSRYAGVLQRSASLLSEPPNALATGGGYRNHTVLRKQQICDRLIGCLPNVVTHPRAQ